MLKVQSHELQEEVVWEDQKRALRCVLDCGREVTGVEQPLNQGGERSAGLDGKVCRSLSPDKGERQVLAQFEEWKVSRAHCSDLQLHTIQRP